MPFVLLRRATRFRPSCRGSKCLGVRREPADGEQISRDHSADASEWSRKFPSSADPKRRAPKSPSTQRQDAALNGLDIEPQAEPDARLQRLERLPFIAAGFDVGPNPSQFMSCLCVWTAVDEWRAKAELQVISCQPLNVAGRMGRSLPRSPSLDRLRFHRPSVLVLLFAPSRPDCPLSVSTVLDCSGRIQLGIQQQGSSQR